MFTEVIFALSNMGSRSWLLFLILSSALAYHRLVKPMKLFFLAVLSVSLILGALLFGFIRDYKEVSVEKIPDVSVLSVANEFQILYGTAYDLLQKKEEGSLWSKLSPVRSPAPNPLWPAV